ncbi:hypothetical protein LUW74_07700 [Actinomadura madurae]|uniref:hypothetical protein n=1 Tax=Actinomadura madurae TaxID=1993 RepID=UPI002026AA10|nr:hypothetical protein [Actinomadura madurae]URN03241.1 hypothetical protein LUW74_07700 [Actinomadura madurae]
MPDSARQPKSRESKLTSQKEEAVTDRCDHPPLVSSCSGCSSRVQMTNWPAIQNVRPKVRGAGLDLLSWAATARDRHV